MGKVERFEDLEIWQIANAIAVDIHLLCDKEPHKSDWGMKDQIRRAACSMSDNMAEGFEYNNNPDFIRFLNYAKGSSGEFRNKLAILNKAEKSMTKYLVLCIPKALNSQAKPRNSSSI